jgi:CRP-like cAMP-binding protein
MTNPLIRKLEQRDRLSEAEKRIIETIPSQFATYGPGQEVVAEGERPKASKLLVEGVCFRFNAFADGRRQINAIHIAGDFVDLHSFLIHKMDHGIAAATACTFAAVPHEALTRVTEEHPHLTRLLWLSTLIDSSILRQWLTASGRRSAAGQTAHLFCELYLRNKSVGLARDNAFPFPLTQAQLGDCLGLSLVHVNRTLQELRSEGLVSWRSGEVRIEDWDRLAQLAEFDPTYLHLKPEPR